MRDSLIIGTYKLKLLGNDSGVTRRVSTSIPNRMFQVEEGMHPIAEILWIDQDSALAKQFAIAFQDEVDCCGK